MKLKVNAAKDQSRTVFKKKLARRTVLQLLFLTLIPFLVIGAFAVIRLRSQLEQQVTTQVLSVSGYYTEQLANMARTRGDALTELLNKPRVSSNLPMLVSTAIRDSSYVTARFQTQDEFSKYTAISVDPIFDQLMVIRKDGTVAFSTYDLWEEKDYGNLPSITPLLDKDGTQFVFDPQPLYKNKFVMVTSRIVRDENGESIATIFGTTLSALPASLLNYAETLLPSAKSYYYIRDQGLIGLDAAKVSLVNLQLPADQLTAINGLAAQGSDDLHTLPAAITGVESFALAKEINNLQTYFIFYIPTEVIYSQIQVFSPATIAIFFLAIALVGVLIYFGTNRTIKPLESLSNIAQQFARGDWSQRAKVNRDDEVGQLSFSFNQMANDLQDLYQSLEAKVEERSHQLRTASEVALLATSGTNRDEMIQQAVDLLKDRFGYYYSAIYMMDETGDYASLRGASSTDRNVKIQTHLRVPVGSKSVVGQVAATQNPMLVGNLNDDRILRDADSVMPASLSEATVPMVLGSQIIGVIDIQSQNENAFDSDTLAILQTLANQLATGLRNVLLVESSQVNLEETAMLYRSSRQISQAKNESEVVKALTESLGKTSFFSLLLSVEPTSLKIISYTDPKTTVIDDSLLGISLPLQRGADRLIDNPILILEDLKSSSDFENLTAFLSRRGCRSAALLPILENGRPSKLIALGTRENIQLTSSRLQPYASLAEVTSGSFDRFAVLKTLQERLKEIQALESIGKTVSTETEAQLLYKTLHNVVSNQIGRDLGFAIVLFDQKNNQIEIPFRFHNGMLPSLPPSELIDGLTSYVLSYQKPLLLNKNVNEAAQSLGEMLQDPMPMSWLGIPLLFNGISVGAVIIEDMENENRFKANDISLLNTIAPQIATAIRNSQLKSEIVSTETAYEQEHFLLDTLLTNTPDRVAFKDKELRYLRVSNAVANGFGYRNCDDFVGKNDLQIMGTETGQESFDEEKRVIETGQPIIDQVEKLVDAHNNENWRLISKMPLFDSDGNPLGLLGISRDITAVKKAEELAQVRAQRLMTTSEIARDTSGLLDLEVLLKNAVNLVLDRFGFYHASIFLIDPLGENAILRESTGEAGLRMKTLGHKLAVGSSSIVGQVTSRGEPLVVNEVRRYENYFPNPLLPDTRAEMAIPLKIGNRILGVLDVQSTMVNAFSTEDVNTLQILADQLAIAIINAEIYTSSQKTLAQHRSLHQISAAASASRNVEEALRTTAIGMQNARQEDRISIHILSDNNELVLSAMAGFPANQSPKDVIPVGEGIIGQVALNKQPIRLADVLTDPYYIPTDDDVRSELAVPILYTDRLVGVLNLESEKIAAYNENDEEILSTMATNLGSIIANAQLVSQVTRQVERQQQIFEITSKIRRSVDMNSIIETSTSELCKALRAQKATMRLSVDTDFSKTLVSQPSDKDNNGHNKGSKSNGKGSSE
ncbi:MAG TPA: GAF domain-containing protein [Longilinea sp.]|nr:GAF domain-containing protein [Longilinea sp.]